MGLEVRSEEFSKLRFFLRDSEDPREDENWKTRRCRHGHGVRDCQRRREKYCREDSQGREWKWGQDGGGGQQKNQGILSAADRIEDQELS